MIFRHTTLAPTAQNAQAVIDRLLRKAQLQPALSGDIMQEAIAIEALWKAGALPNGAEPATPLLGKISGIAPRAPEPFPQPVAVSMSAPAKPTSWQRIYFALLGYWPDGPAFRLKHPHPTRPGQFYYLGTSGALRIGPNKQRSVPEHPRIREALLARADEAVKAAKANKAAKASKAEAQLTRGKLGLRAAQPKSVLSLADLKTQLK